LLFFFPVSGCEAGKTQVYSAGTVVFYSFSFICDMGWCSCSDPTTDDAAAPLVGGQVLVWAITIPLAQTWLWFCP